MDDFNLSALISLLIRLFAVGIVIVYIVPKQFGEVLRPKDWLTNLRWQILLLFVFSALAAIPALSYQGIRVYGLDSELLRTVASILGNLSNLATSILLVLIYNYKDKR